MKKSKFLTLLVFAPLLASCGASGAKVPKFAKYGDEIKGEAFFKAYDKKLADGAFAKKAKLGSIVAESFYELYNSFEITRGKEKIKDAFSDDISEGKISIDTKNVILKQEQKNTGLSGDVTPSHTSASSGELKSTKQIQVEKIKGKNYAINIDEDKKAYVVLEEVSKKADLVEELDIASKSYILEGYKEAAGILKVTYESASKEEQKKYKFYQNGEIYTAEYDSEEKEEGKEAKVTYLSKTVVQLDFTDGKWSSKYYNKNTTTTEHLKDHEDEYGDFYVKGDVYVDNEETVYTVSFNKKEPNFKAIDISEYKKVDA